MSHVAIASTEVVLQVSNLHKRWGRTQVLRGVDLTLTAGEKHALIGPNGAGKSTLFHLVSGLAAVTSGRVELYGRDITHLAPHRINRLGLSRSFQVTNVFATLSVFENLRCAALRTAGAGYAFWRRLESLSQVDEKVHGLLASLGLAAQADTQAGQLTYAEQRALELGMALATDAQVLLLDEPTAGMNRTEVARMVELIETTCVGRALLIVEHDMEVVFSLADRISVMVVGEIIATGTPAFIREHAEVRAAYLGHSAAERA
jgi:branched-chain amino acid transport system ATP-binding protein